MNTISLCMIVKDEELVIERCLKNIKSVVDEIIIVDTGSTDTTKEICKKYTDKIYDFKWCNDFSMARNYSFSKATSDYIMWLDADDVVPEKSVTQLKKLKKNMTYDTYMLKYDMGFTNNTPTLSFYRERILKNCQLAKWQGFVHECVVPFGKIKECNISVEHRKEKFENSDRNINIYKDILKKRKLSPREQYYYGRELFDHKDYKNSINVLNEFITNNNGWIENIIDACYIVSKCYHELNDFNNELTYLFKTFQYDKPRANVCCKVGDYFLYNKQYNLSIYWYLLATKSKYRSHNNGFIENIYFDYYPYLQLCLAHYNLGNIEKSKQYNLKADECLSTETTRNNIKFFNSLNKA